MLLHRFPILRGLRTSDLLFSLKKEKKSRENVRRFLPTTKSSRHNVFFQGVLLFSISHNSQQTIERKIQRLYLFSVFQNEKPTKIMKNWTSLYALNII